MTTESKVVAVKAVSTRELLSTTSEEEARGARPAIPIEMAEQLVNLIHERDPMAILYMRHQPKEEPVQIIGIDGPKIIRELFRDLTQRVPILDDLLARIRKLHEQLRRSHPTVQEIHWLFENLQVEGKDTSFNKLKKTDVLKELDRVVSCDAALQMASRHDVQTVLNKNKFLESIQTLTLRSPLDEDMFVNLDCFAAICKLISLNLTSTRPGEVVKVLEADTSTATSHSFEQLVWTWLQRPEMLTRGYVILLSYRDTMVNTAIHYALEHREAKRPGPKLILQTHKVRFQSHRLLDVLHAWADIYRLDLKQFVNEFTMIVQLAIPSYHDTIAPLEWMFDMWASSSSFFKEQEYVVGIDEKQTEKKESETTNVRLRFAGMFNRLLQLKLDRFAPVARIPALVKAPLASSTVDSSVSFSKDLTSLLSKLTLDSVPIPPPSNPFAIMSRTYWLPGNVRRNPASIPILWQNWLLTLTQSQLRKPLVVDTDDKKDNFDFIGEMLRNGAPWPEIVDALVFARTLHFTPEGEAIAKPDLATLESQRESIPEMQKIATTLLKEAKETPWIRWTDLPSFAKGVQLFHPIPGADYFRSLGRHLCARLVQQSDDFKKWTHDQVPKGLPRHIAMTISRNNRWFIDLDYPWARNYAACVWQMCRSPETLAKDIPRMAELSVSVDIKNPVQRKDQLIVFELPAPKLVSEMRI